MEVDITVNYKTPADEFEKLKEEEIKQYFYADHVLTISASDTAAIYASLPPQRVHWGCSGRR